MLLVRAAAAGDWTASRAELVLLLPCSKAISCSTSGMTDAGPSGRCCQALFIHPLPSPRCRAPRLLLLCAGHGDPRWVEAVAEQANMLSHVSNLFHTAPQVGGHSGAPWKTPACLPACTAALARSLPPSSLPRWLLGLLKLLKLLRLLGQPPFHPALLSARPAAGQAGQASGGGQLC